MEPFVGLLGPNPGSEELLAKQIPQLSALSTTIRGVQTEVSLEVAGEGVGTRFPHPWDVLMWSRGVAHRYVALRYFELLLGFREDPHGGTFFLMRLL